MNDIVKCSVDSRKNALFSAYNITDEGVIKQINDYFAKLEDFAKGYDDVMKFESDFAQSPLAQEYTDLFVMAMNSVDPQPQGPSEAEELRDEMVDDATRFARRRARQEAYDVARDIPGLGQAMTAKQHMDFFGRFRKKKDD